MYIRVHPDHPAPDFTLPDSDGYPVRLHAMAGRRVVLYFHPGPPDRGSLAQARHFRAHHEEIQDQDAAVLAVSASPLDDQRAMSDRHGLPFHLLSDEDGAVHDQYGAWRRRPLRPGLATTRRCTFLIDPGMRVTHVYPRIQIRHHVKQVLRDLRNLPRLRP